MSSSILFVFHFVPPCALCVEYIMCASQTQEITARERPGVVFSLLKRERVGGREGTWNIDRGMIPPIIHQCVHSAHKSYFIFVSSKMRRYQESSKLLIQYTLKLRNSSGNLISSSGRALLTRRRVCLVSNGKVLQ